MKGQKRNDNAGITLVALVVSIVVMLILAGVSINAVVGENGVITQAQNAARAAEEAELWEQIQAVLFDGLASGLEGQDLVDYCNAQFAALGLDASMGLTEDGYVLTYGKYTRTTLELSSSLATVNSFVAVEGDASLWTTTENEDGTLTITGYKGDMSGDIIVPNIINGQLVTDLGQYVFAYEDITSVIFNYGLKTIGYRAFVQCSNLDCTIEFPSTLTYIGEECFYYSTGISTNLDTLAKQKVTMGKNAFYGCSKITGDIQTYINNVLGEEQSDGTYEFSVTTIPEGICSGFSGITGDLVIPSCVTTIETNAFYNCSGVESISFESTDTLTYIGKYAFYGCSGMTSDLSLPNTVTFIGTYAFYGCSGLTSINIPTSLTTIGSYAFYKCSGATNSITIPSVVNYYTEDSDGNITSSGLGVGKYTFYSCRKLTGITFATPTSSQTIAIGSYAFSDCSNVAAVTFPSVGTVTLSTYAFQGVGNSATALYLYNSNSITTLGTYSFYGCTTLTSFTYNSSITLIPSYCFYNCDSMTTMPSIGTVTKVNSYAYFRCTSLGLDSSSYSNYLEESNTKFLMMTWLKNSVITSIGDYAFGNCTQMKGNIDNSTTQRNVKNGEITISGLAFDGCTSITSYKTVNLATESDGTTVKTSIDNSEFEGNTVLYDTEGNEITEIVIPANITSIGSRAFYGCTSITKVIFHDNITSIGSYAFYNCTNLEFIGCNSILKNGTELETGETSSSYDSTATYTLGDLTGYGFPHNHDYTTIQSYTFYYCTSLKNICYSGETSGTASTDIAKVVGTTAHPTIVYTPTVTYEEGTEPTDDGGDGTLHIIDVSWTKTTNKERGYFFPDNITYLDTYAFDKCSSLNIVLAFNQVETISTSCFYQCNFTGIKWGDQLYSVGSFALCDSAFQGEFVVPDTVYRLDIRGARSSQMTSIYIGDNVAEFSSTIGLAYQSTALTSVTIESKALTSLGHDCFNGCTNLVYADLPWGQITTISYSVWVGVTSFSGELDMVSLVSIGNNSFVNCPELSVKIYLNKIESFDLEKCFINCSYSLVK